MKHFIYIEGDFDDINAVCRNVWNLPRPPPGDFASQVSLEYVHLGRLSKCETDEELQRRVEGEEYTRDRFVKVTFKTLAAMSSCILQLNKVSSLKLYHVPPKMHRMISHSTTCHVDQPFYFCDDNQMRVGTVGIFKGLESSDREYTDINLQFDVRSGEFLPLTRGPLDPPLQLSDEEVKSYPLPPLSVLAYDLETDTLMPESDGACVNMVSLVFGLKKCMVIAIASPSLDVDALAQTLNETQESECAFVLVETEESLLLLMAQVIKNWDPANTLSFNGTLFDNRYMRMRCEANGLVLENFCYSLFGPEFSVTFKTKEFFSSGKGTKIFEYMADHRGTFDGCVYSANVLRNQVNSLNHNLEFLGILKMSNVPYTEIASMRHNADGMAKLLWYCLADSVLLWCLDLGGELGDILSCIGVDYEMFEREYGNREGSTLVLSNSTRISKLTDDCASDAWRSKRAGLNMSQFYIARAREAGLQKDSICLSGEVAPVKGVLLRTAHQEGFVMDFDFAQAEEETSYAGGEVQASCTSLFAPESHLLNDAPMPEKIPLSILTMDYTSMYPNIIVTEGMCFVCSRGIRRKLGYGPEDQERLTNNAKNMFLPRVVARLLSGRQTCKKQMAVFESQGIAEGPNSDAWVWNKYWTIMSNAMKVLCNSLYGAFGSRFLGDTGIAENVTEVGRENITRIANLVPRITGTDIIKKYPQYCPPHLHSAVTELELSIVYGDTDSVLVLLRGPPQLSYTWSCFVGTRIAVEIKEWSLFYDPDKLPPQGDMDIENYGAAFFGMAPKVYGMLEDASMEYHIKHSSEICDNPKPMFKMKYRGFSGVRSNSLPLGAQLARKFVQAILFCGVPFAPMPEEIRAVWGGGPGSLISGMKSELIRAFHGIYALANATGSDIPEAARSIVDNNLLVYKTMLKKTDNPGVPHRVQKMVCKQMESGKLVPGYTAPPTYGDRVTFAYVESPNGKGFLQPTPIADKSSCAFPSHEFFPNGTRKVGFKLNAIAVIGCVSPLFQALTGKTEQQTKRELCDLWNSRGIKPIFGASASTSLVARGGNENDESRKRRAKVRFLQYYFY